MQLRSLLVLALGAIALAGLVLALFRRDPQHAPTPVAPALPAAAPQAAGAQDGPAVEAERERIAEPRLDVAAIAPAAVTRGAPARLFGRCVAAESGRALAGVQVECVRQGSAERLPLGVPFTTGVDGHFEVQVDSGVPLRLRAHAPGRSPRVAHWSALAPGEAIDLGDVRLAAGFVVEGQVLERDGAPVAGATVVLSAVFVGLDAGDDVPASLSGRTDASGHFRIDGDVPAGRFPLALSTRGWRLVGPAWVSVDALAGAEPVAAVAERLPSIAGHVVDTDGVAVRGVQLSLAAGLLPTPPVRTDADGAFELFARGDDRAPAQVRVQDPGPCEPPAGPLPVFEWGTRDARIVLRRALTVELQVVERASGAPVTDYGVACFRTDSSSSLEQGVRHVGTHPGGRLAVERVRRGENRLQVRPASAELLDSDWILFDAREGSPPLRVELERMQRARVRVVTARGERVAGSRVTLHRRESNASPPGARFLFDTDDEPLFDGARLLPPVAGGTTDAVGQTELWFPSDLEACTLRVTGSEHLERIEARPLLRAGQVHEVVVEIGARVEGRCLVAGYGDRPLALQFVRDGSTTLSAVLALLGPQGEFRSPPLAPGALAIHLSVPADGDIGIRAPLEPPLQYVALGEGEVLRLELDARAWAAGSLVGSVRLDGAAPPGGSLLLQLVLPSLKLRFGLFALDAQGAFATEGLPPGRWTALLYAGGPAYLELGETFDLAGGERLEVQLEFASMRRVLRLLKADGKSPLAGQAIVVVSSEPAFPATADAEGRVRFDRALEGEIEFFLVGDGASRYRAILPEPGEEHARDVVLPIEP